jgi:hypothetical protein
MQARFQSELLQESDHLEDQGVDAGADSSLPKYGMKANTT